MQRTGTIVIERKQTHQLAIAVFREEVESEQTLSIADGGDRIALLFKTVRAIPTYRWVACGDHKWLDKFVCFACAPAHAKHTNLSKRTLCGVAATCTVVLPPLFKKAEQSFECLFPDLLECFARNSAYT